MLANFRATAGLDTQGASPPGGWDTTTGNLRGHFSGHFLTLLAQAYAGSGDSFFSDKLAYMVTELGTCQEVLDARSARVRVPGMFGGKAVRLTGAPKPPPQGQYPNYAWPSEYVALPAGIVSGLGDFTIATWLNATTLTNGAKVFDFGSSVDNHLVTGQWAHVAVMRSGNTARRTSTASRPPRTRR